MGFKEIYQVIIDVTAEGARKSLKSLKKDVTEAEGAFGKMKVAASGGLDFVRQNAGAFALAAGTAIAAFGVKAVGAFTDTAKAAQDLGVQIGSTTESASRWIAIADDVGGSASDIAAGAKEIAKNLDAAKWEEYGIKTRDAGGNARDTSDILADALGAVSAITNEHDRATAGIELFSKGWKGLSPLVGHTAEEYRNMLAAVEDGQVITSNEAKKAERMRLAEDALSDAFGEVTLAVGQLVAEGAPALESFADAVGLVSQAMSKSSEVTDGWVDDILLGLGTFGIYTVLVTIPELIGNITDAIGEEALATDGLVSSLGPQIDALKAAQTATEDTAGATSAATDVTSEYASATDDAAEALADRIKVEDELYSKELSRVDAEYAYLNQARENLKAIEDYNTVLKEHGDSQEDVTKATEEARQSAVDTASAYADTTDAAKGSEEYITAMVASLTSQYEALAPGSPLRTAITDYINALMKVPGRVTTLIDIQNATDRASVIIGDLGRNNRSGFSGGGTTGSGLTAGRAAGKGAGGGGNGLASDPIIEWYPKQVEESTQQVVRSEEEMWDLRFEMGEVGEAEYRAHQQQRLATEQKYGDAYMDAWRKLHAFELADQRAADAARAEADRQAKADAAERDRQAKEDQAARDKAEKERKDAERDAEREAERAHLEELRRIFQHAADQREMDDAARAADAANAEVIWNQADPDASPADRERALRNMAQALYRRADAGANLGGLDDGTVEWARAVRASLRADEANVPALTPYIEEILRGIPDLAAGGVAKAQPGGRIVRVAEAGRDEAIIPLDDDPRTAGGGGDTFIFHVLGGLDQVAARKIERALTDLRRGWR